MLVTRRANGTLVVAVWNYAPAGEGGASKTFRLALKGSNEARYRLQFVDVNHGSSLSQWRALGSPAFPTLDQIQKLVTGLTSNRPRNIRSPIPLTWRRTGSPSRDPPIGRLLDIYFGAAINAARFQQRQQKAHPFFAWAFSPTRPLWAAFSEASAVSRLTILLKLLFCPPAVVS